MNNAEKPIPPSLKRSEEVHFERLGEQEYQKRIENIKLKIRSTYISNKIQFKKMKIRVRVGEMILLRCRLERAKRARDNSHLKGKSNA